MTTRTDVLRIRIETDNDGNARASLAGVADSADKVAQSTGGAATATTAAADAMKGATAAATELTAAQTARAETEEEAIARIHAMVQASLAADEATYARVQSEAALGAAQERNTAITAEQIAADKALAAAQTEAMQRYTLEMAPLAQLNTLLEKRTLTSAEVAAAEQILDDAQARGIISAGELAAAFEALDAAKIKDTVATQANTAANVENAASQINSRTAYSLEALISDAATGQFSRSRREVAALANETGLLTKLFSPLGIGLGAAALAVGVFTKAVIEGEHETSAFNKALILTGGYAGESAAQLQDMARTVAQVNDVTQHAAAAVVAQVTQSGRFYGDMIRQVSATAIALQQATGQSIDKTISQFEQLGRDPVKGVLDLNNSLHFLTQSTYDQITALEQQGQHDQAAQVAQKAYADAMIQRAHDVTDNLGYLEKAWRGITGAAKDAWDAMMDAGRPTTLQQKIDAVQQRIADAQKQFVDPVTGRTIALSDHEKDVRDQTIKNLQAQLHQLQTQQLVAPGGDLYGAGQALAQRINDQRINAQQALGSGAGLSAQEKLDSRLNELAVQKAQALYGVVDPDQRAKIIDHFNNQVADAARQYDSAIKKLTPKQSHKGENALDSFSQYVGNLTAQSQGNQMDDSAIGKYITGVEKLNAEFDKAVAKGASVTAATAEYDKGIQALGNDLAKTQAKQAAADAAYKQQLDDQLALRQRAIDLQVASVGMGSKEVQRMQELNQINEQFNQKLAQLNKERDRGSISLQQYQTRLQALKQDEQAEIDAAVSGYARMDAAMGDWRNGAIRAMEDMRDQFSDVAGQIDQTFSNAFNNMNQAIVQWVQTGKFSGKQFADNLIADLVQIELHVLESQILQSILGAFMVSGTGIASSYMAGGGSSYAASGVNWNVGVLGSAQGNVFASPSLSQYSNQIVNQPTLFAFAQGAGVMGEGGRPEAIIPLTRTANGDLGVKAQGGGNVQVIVENHSDSQAQVQQSKDANGGDIIKVIVGQAVNEVNKQIGRGGSTYKVLQQTFGLNRRGVPVSGG